MAKTTSCISSTKPPTITYTCNHSSPPTPHPLYSSSTSTTPSLCFSCHLSHPKSTLSTTISRFDKQIESIISHGIDSALAVSNDKDKNEILNLAKMRTREIVLVRNSAVDWNWAEFARVWNGATKVDEGNEYRGGHGRIVEVKIECERLDREVDVVIYWRYKEGKVVVGKEEWSTKDFYEK